MSWSTELWDQFDTISCHTAKGIDFLDKLGHFVKDRCVIETDYASKLRKLAKNYDLKKKDDEKEFTYCQAFGQMMKELSYIAGQHEVIAENLSVKIVQEVQTYCKELRDERKRHLNEGTKYQTLLTTSLNQLDKSKKSYDKAFKESEKARDNYQKADDDLNLSRADLEKAKTAKLTKDRLCEHSKSDYAKQLQVANQAQREHYNIFMPKVFQQLQDLEQRRIECTRDMMKLSAIIQKDVMPILNKCLDGIVETASTIDHSRDAQIVIDRFKSGMQPPDDIPFEDLSNRSPSTNNCDTDSVSTQSKGSSLVYSHSLKSESFRHTFTARGLKKRTMLRGLFGANKDDFSDLPPNQRRKKLQAKIDQLNEKISKANTVKTSLIGMRQAYEENSAFGDPKEIESQLRKNELEIQQLAGDLSKHLVLMEEIDASRTQQHQTVTNNNRTISNHTSENDASSKSPSISNSNHRASLGPESELSRTNSDNSLRPDLNNRAEGTKSSATNRTSNSFNDSISDSISQSAIPDNSPTSTIAVHSDAVDGRIIIQEEHANSKKGIPNTNNTNNAQQQDQNDLEHNSEILYEAPSELPAQAHAKALYPFKAEPAGSISMEEGEQFDVIEYDQGDGWTRVRRKIFNPEDDDFIGFVPTTYIAIEQIPTT